MTKRPIAARVIAFCVMGGVAASMAISAAGPASASTGAAASSSATKARCAGSVCETVTLAGDRITVTTTVSTKAAVHWCVKPAVNVHTPTTNLTVKARPFCDQTAPRFHFVLQLRNLSFPVTVTSRWSHASGAPSVTFRQ